MITKRERYREILAVLARTAPRIIPPKHEEITFAPLWAPLHNLRLQKDCLHDKPSDGGSGICGVHSGGTSSAQTRNPDKVPGPKVWVRGASAASRPCAMRTRPIRGALLRGSNVCQRPPR